MTSLSNDVKQQLISFYQLQTPTQANALHSRAVNAFCLRKTWLSMRLPPVSDLMKTRMKKRLEAEQTIFIQECQALGWVVHKTHPKTEKPITFQAPFGIIEVTALAKNDNLGWFLLEMETIDDYRFHGLIHQGIRSTLPELWGHCILALGEAKLTTCAVIISSLSGDMYVELIHFDKEEHLRLLDICRSLMSNMVAPPRIKQHLCEDCEYSQQCWEAPYIPPPSCFTCVYRQAGRDGVYCKRLTMDIAKDVWQEGCNEHLYLSELLNFAKKTNEIVLENGDNAITYELQDGKTLINCGAKAPKKDLMFTSREIHLGGVLTIHNPLVQAIKEQFAGAKVISNE